jgi:hypothetical protein
MATGIYMDVHIPKSITNGLRLRGKKVLTAQEDGSALLPDPALLDRASQLGLLLFTCDDDFLAEAQGRQRSGETFAGVICAHQMGVSIGEYVPSLQTICAECTYEELESTVTYLPL